MDRATCYMIAIANILSSSDAIAKTRLNDAAPAVSCVLSRCFVEARYILEVAVFPGCSVDD